MYLNKFYQTLIAYMQDPFFILIAMIFLLVICSLIFHEKEVDYKNITIPKIPQPKKEEKEGIQEDKNYKSTTYSNRLNFYGIQ